ncbi:MinD/ParA family protein [[Mycobacterium] wendilense]|uniref:MinD/ParA family protein n=1 Tax=[Mycobacterium] wendilense TaxID=3064284 RepID=A0ABN9NU74_9MYCO|nr:MinD/ParA family protein [Mycolicibacterium sp. MU0050]CAJ1578427.1 MinD/ParA family protein [Mycolicibacterium sp. MU0050]
MTEREEFLRDRQAGPPQHPTPPSAGAPSGDQWESPPPTATPGPAPGFIQPQGPLPQQPGSQPTATPHAAPQQPGPHQPPGSQHFGPGPGLQQPPWLDFGGAPTPSPRKPRPTRGWRRAVHVATFGLINLGPSKAERRAAELQAIIQAPLRSYYKVGVLGKGGVGKTSVAASVGSVFAELRPSDRVVAIDADTAFGRLGSRVDPSARGSYWELAGDRNLESFADLRARIGNNAAGLYVLAGEPASTRRRVLDPAIYREAALRLDRHFTISIIDCGSTMDAPVTQEALRDLDALIVVSSPWADGAGAAAQTMEWLANHGMGELLRRTVVVLNDSDGHADKKTKAALAQQFISRGQVVVEVPFDPHLRPGGVIDVTREMAPATRLRFLEITAAIAGHFSMVPPHPVPGEAN